MRLFISINFDKQVKDKIISVQKELKIWNVSGNFTPPENLHLTLVFFGEAEESRIRSIQAAMLQTQLPKFEFALKNINSFKSGKGDIFWLGVDNAQKLTELENRLVYNLNKRSLDALSHEKFTPHITLARDVNYENFDYILFNQNFKGIPVTADKICLMQSTRVKNRMVYTEIFKKNLFNE